LYDGAPRLGTIRIATGRRRAAAVQHGDVLVAVLVTDPSGDPTIYVPVRHSAITLACHGPGNRSASAVTLSCPRRRGSFVLHVQTRAVIPTS
jgi:hypothetical protein